MLSARLFVPTAEAAFIAGLSDRQINRVIDEHLVPEVLFARHEGLRSFTRLCAAFAAFYFDTEDWLLASARRQVLEELTARVVQQPGHAPVLALAVLPPQWSWKVSHRAVEVDVAAYVHQAQARALEVDQAQALVVSDPEILRGSPVFAGSRVPVATVLGSITAGIGLDRLQASYPFLTEAHVQAARVYDAVHPRRGRPLRLEQALPGGQRRLTRVVRGATA